MVKLDCFLFFNIKYVNDINILSLKRLFKFELIALNKDDIPAKCKLNITKSTEPPECNYILAKGG